MEGVESKGFHTFERVELCRHLSAPHDRVGNPNLRSFRLSRTVFTSMNERVADSTKFRWR